MKIPQAEQAIIERKKIRDYLLSQTHPVGRFKATWFLQLGYEQQQWQQLELDLREQHLPFEAKEMVPNQFGTKYQIRGSIVTPNGNTVELISIWIIRTGESVPRLVTAYPGGHDGV